MKKTIINLIRVFLIGAIACAGFLSIIKPVNAETITSDKNIGFGNQYDGEDKDLIVENGATVALDGLHTFRDVIVRDGGVITHNPVNKVGKVAYTLPFNAKWNGFVKIQGKGYDYKLVFDGAVTKVKICIDANKVCDETSTWIEYNEGAGLDDYVVMEGWKAYNVGIKYYYIGGATSWFKLMVVEKGGDGLYHYVGDNEEEMDFSKTPSDYYSGLVGKYYLNAGEYNFSGTPQERTDFSNRLGSSYIKNFDATNTVVTSTEYGGLRLDIRGKLELDNGFINADYKGYPGGKDNDPEHSIVKNYPGYGPGGGGAYEPSDLGDGQDDDVGGGGGSFGGSGANGFQGWFYQAVGGVVYPTQWDMPINGDIFSLLDNKQQDPYENDVPIIFGSGGGSGIHEYNVGTKHGQDYYIGGRGGGSVIISANSIEIKNGSKITANGDLGKDEQGGNTLVGYAGAGSGGLIYLKVSDTTNQWINTEAGNPEVKPGILEYNQAQVVGSQFGSGTVWISSKITSAGGNITANGGSGSNTQTSMSDPSHCSTAMSDHLGIYNGCGDGGGGRIVIDVGQLVRVKVSKMVEVIVEWKEGNNPDPEKVKLKTILRDVSPQ